MEIDARGLKCPIPIVKLGAAVKRLAVGEEVRITADDKEFLTILKAWSDKTGHLLVSLNEQDPQGLSAVVKKAHA